MTADQWPYEATGRSSTIGNVTLTEYLESDLSDAPAARRPEVTREAPGQAEAGQAAGHIDPAAAGRYRQAQTELVGLIREENLAIGQEPEADQEVLPDSLADWLDNRVAELEQAEADAPEIAAIG